MAEAGSITQGFKTPDRPDNSSSRRDERRSHSKDGKRSSSNSRDGTGHGGNGSYDDRSRQRQDSSGNGNGGNRDRSSSGGRHDKRHNYQSPQSKYHHNSPQQHGHFNQNRSHQQGGFNGASPQSDYNDWSSPEYNGNNYSWQQDNWRGYGGPRGSPHKGGRGQHGGNWGYDGQTPGRNQQRWNEDPDVFLSKTLSSILRHNAEKFGLKLMKGGFLYVEDILYYVKKLNGFKPDDVRRVVESNDKKRFSLESEEGRLKIRANQGHSIEVEDLDLKPILSADNVPMVIHGTYFSSWEYIRETGLKRMNRNHIHFAAGEPGKNGVISGMRKTCEVMIHIDLEKALKDGLKFFISANNVILSSGDENGVIYPCYFSGVLDRMKNYRLDFDNTISSAKTEKEKFTEKPSDNKKRKKKSKGKHNNTEDYGPKEWKETETIANEQKTENEVKEREDGATTDDTSLPVAKKQHLSNPAGAAEPPKAECSSTKKAEPEVTKNENQHLKDDEVKSKNWDEPMEVTTVEESIRAVNCVYEKSPSHVAVSCVGENLGKKESKIGMIVISCYPNTFVYHLKDDNRSLVKDGQLEKLFLDKNISKVFHDIGAVSASLIHEFDILMNGVLIWDISILFGKVSIPHMDMEELGFKKGLFKNWTKQNEEFGKKLSSNYDLDVVRDLYERGKMISDLYRQCIQKVDEHLKKKIRKEIYEVAIPSKESFLAEKVDALKLEMKGKKPADKPATQQQPQQQQQHQQKGKSNKGKQGKGKNKK